MNFSHAPPRYSSNIVNPRTSISHFIILIMTGFLLVACQVSRQTVSLDEAKQISLKFSDAPFEPPPRSILDLKLQIGIVSPIQLKTPCSSTYQLSVKEYSSLLENLPPYPQSGCKVYALRDLAREEMHKGNYSQGIELQKMTIAALPASVKGGRGNRFTELSKYYAYAGDFISAQRALSSAKSWYSRTDYSDEGKTYYLFSAMGLIEQAKGNLIKAEKYFKEAIMACDKSEKSGNWMVTRITTKSDLAENLLFQERLLEAEILARELIHNTRYMVERKYLRGKVLLILSRILLELRRYSESEYVAKAAIIFYLSSYTECSSVFFNLSRKILACTMMAQNRWEEAISQFNTIGDAMKNDPEAFEVRFGGDVDWATALLLTGQTRAAIDMLRVSLDRTIERLGEKHYNTTEIRGMIALTHAAAGNREAALKGFMNAVPILLTQPRQAEMGSTQDQRLTLIIEGYIRLLSDILSTPLETKSGINGVDISFSLSEAIRNRLVKGEIHALSTRAAVKDPELADLTRREQDMEKQLNALHGALANTITLSSSDETPKVVQYLRQKIDKMSDARLAIIKEIKSRFPKYSEMVNPTPISLKEAKASLNPKESLVSIYIGRDRSFVWAVPYHGEVAFASIPLSREAVREMVEKVRYALEPNAKTLGEIPTFDLETAYSIYQAFLKPVKKGWKNAENLLIVSNGALGYLPLSLLPTKPTKLNAEKKLLLSNYQDVPWLVRSHAVTILPSVSSLKTLRALPPSDLTRRAFVGFGDPCFSAQQAKTASMQREGVQIAATEKSYDYSLRGLSIARVKTDQLATAVLAILPRLPETADEIRSIAEALNADLTKDVFIGTQANEQQVKTLDLSAYKVVAFATHGLAPGDLNGLLQPALALSSPEVSGIEGDGLLKMGEILGLRLNADWVILSACNTGAGKEKGAEALSGLGRAFFYAGARALLVSNWPVETTSAKELTTDLFKRQAKNPTLSRAQALRQSMLSLIDGAGCIDPETEKVLFSYAHPIFWAPFSLVGG